MIDPTQLVGLGSIPVIIALTETVKRTWETCPKQLFPLLNILLGIGFNLVLAYLLKSDYGLAALLGLIAGLSAAGLYSSSKALTETIPHG